LGEGQRDVEENLLSGEEAVANFIFRAVRRKKLFNIFENVKFVKSLKLPINRQVLAGVK